jgi:ferredoxin-thioredoxin reductase catalytic subunit
MSTFKINKDLLHKVNKRGYCLCSINKADTCPCNFFLETDNCRCGVYIKIEED